MSAPSPTGDSRIGPDAAALLERLRRDAGVRRTLAELRTAFVEVFPEHATDVDRDGRLAGLLEDLEQTGELERYKQRSTSGLPAGVRMSQAPRESSLVAGRDLPVLHEALRAARSVSRGWTPDEVAVLERLSHFLRDEPDAPEVARRERSFQLFENERRLDELHKTRFRHLGLVDDQLLRCVDTPMPFPWVRVGRRPHARLLVVENSATFDSLAVVLEAQREPPYDIIVWGGGRTIEKRLPFTQRLPEHAGIDAVATIAYFGDLDPPGIEIAASTARIAAELDLPPVRPAVELYRALLDAEAVPYGPDYRAYDDADLAWLPSRIAARAVDLHAGGRRVPQEALDRAALAQVLQPDGDSA